MTKYPPMAARHSPGVSTSSANTITNVCSVNGTGPNGTDTHADTAMSAMDNPTNATDRVRTRDAPPISFACSMVRISFSDACADTLLLVVHQPSAWHGAASPEKTAEGDNAKAARRPPSQVNFGYEKV